MKHSWYSSFLKFWTSSYLSLRFDESISFLLLLSLSELPLFHGVLNFLIFLFPLSFVSFLATFLVHGIVFQGKLQFIFCCCYHLYPCELAFWHIIQIFELLRFDPQTGLLTGTNDGTLVNLFLRQFGRMSEKSLCILLLVFQVWNRDFITWTCKWQIYCILCPFVVVVTNLRFLSMVL